MTNVQYWLVHIFQSSNSEGMSLRDMHVCVSTVCWSHLPVTRASLSHRDDYFAYSQTSAGSLASNGYMRLESGSNSGSLIQSQLTHRYTQPHITECSLHTHHSIYKMCRFFHPFTFSLLCFSKAVTLQCIGKLLCSLWHTWNNNVNPQNLILFIWTSCFSEEAFPHLDEWWTESRFGDFLTWMIDHTSM